MQTICRNHILEKSTQEVKHWLLSLKYLLLEHKFKKYENGYTCIKLFNFIWKSIFSVLLILLDYLIIMVIFIWF